ncbi:SPOR domain-containing protein [Asticcacaulis sp. BYS171W]|uniref:SPOR domain-containing protein n=1 Tax=Asticcacaulis aquaticus TaxID=2984212 RepID=A0ABT5HWQ3_9CAUL|nr:SPOR domain-containing protein [Asticcacaulis aquaticus]MDC7684275.1 SPOR domain-containing protein [Asticcacaulis aquaticus]
MVEDNERGTYSPPTEDHLSYETRRPAPSRDQTPITLIASGIVLVVLLLAVVLFYNSGLNSRKVGDVGEPLAGYKDGAIEEAKPLSEDDLIDSAADTSATAPKFANDTEAPQLRDASSAVAPVKPADAAENILPPASKTAPPVFKAEDKPAPVSDAKPAAPPVKPVETPKPVEKPVAVSGGSASVQIGAFSSQAIADREYAQAASTYGMFVGGTSKTVQKVEVNGSTFYRTSFSGFASKEKAKQFCDALKAAGKSCFVK